MKTRNIFAAIVVAIVCTGCTTYSYTSRSVDIQDNAQIASTDLLVDIRPDFSRRVMAESDRQVSAQAAMEEAKYRALVDNKVDVIVDPIYRIENRGTGRKRFKATVVGFAGFYENARTRTQFDELKELQEISKETIEKKLMLDGNVIVLEGLYDHTIKAVEGDAPITIYHNARPCCDKACDKAPAKAAAAPAPKAKDEAPAKSSSSSKRK